MGLAARVPLSRLPKLHKEVIPFAFKANTAQTRSSASPIDPAGMGTG